MNMSKLKSIFAKITAIDLTPKQKKILAVVLAVVALTTPFTINNTYFLHIIILSCVYACLTLSLNLIIGWSGQFSLGHVTFYGMGAYVTTLLVMNVGMNFFLALAISAVFVGVFSALLCFPTLKLKGDYIAVVTLGFGEVFRLFVINAVDITRGSMGIPAIPAPVLFGLTISGKTMFYYFALLLLLLYTVFMIRFNNSGFGMATLTVKQDEIAAASLGIYPQKHKLAAFAIGGVMAGIMGSFYAVYMGMIGPTVFTYSESIKMVSMVVLGGMGSIPGSIIGAFLLTALPEALRAFSDYRMIIYGLAMVLMMIFRPDGIWGANKRLVNEYKVKAMRGVRHD